MPVETHGPEIASHHPIACAGASRRAFPKSIRSCRRKAGMPNRVRGQKQKRQPSSGRRFQEAFFHAVRSFTFPIAPLQGRREPSGLREPQVPLAPSGRRALQVRRELPPPPADPLRTQGTPYRKTSHWRRAKHPQNRGSGILRRIYAQYRRIGSAPRGRTPAARRTAASVLAHLDHFAQVGDSHHTPDFVFPIGGKEHPYIVEVDDGPLA